MKKILLMLILPLSSYAQIGIGIKAGVDISFYDIKDVGLLKTNPEPCFSAFGEYKSDNVTGELEFTYVKASSDPEAMTVQGINFKNNLDVQSLITSLSLKIYPVDNFALKLGGYFNSCNTDYYFNGEKTNISMKDIGIVFGMEAKLYKGLFVDSRILFDLDKKDGFVSQHLMLSAGYKF